MAKSSTKKSVSKFSTKQNMKEGLTESKKSTDGKSSGQFATDADSTLQDLFVSELKDTYWAENHLIKALPKMVSAAGANDLKQALADHLEITKTHASRLENVFELLGEKLAAKKCDAMEGLTMSGEHVIENTVTDSQTRDTGIIMSALKVENFEITTYKGLIQVATSLGKNDVAELLQQNLNEEVEASDMLMEMSQAGLEKQPEDVIS